MDGRLLYARGVDKQEGTVRGEESDIHGRRADPPPNRKPQIFLRDVTLAAKTRKFVELYIAAAHGKQARKYCLRAENDNIAADWCVRGLVSQMGGLNAHPPAPPPLALGLIR